VRYLPRSRLHIRSKRKKHKAAKAERYPEQKKYQREKDGDQSAGQDQEGNPLTSALLPENWSGCCDSFQA